MALNLFRTKSPEHLMAEAAAPERQLKRALSAFDLTCIGIGAIIGTGISRWRERQRQGNKHTQSGQFGKHRC